MASHCCVGWSSTSPQASCSSTCTTGLGSSLKKTNPVVRRSGSTLYWAVNGPDDIVSAVPSVRLLAAISVFDAEKFKQAVGVYQLVGRVMSLVPGVRMITQFHRDAFGD